MQPLVAVKILCSLGIPDLPYVGSKLSWISFPTSLSASVKPVFQKWLNFSVDEYRSTYILRIWVLRPLFGAFLYAVTNAVRSLSGDDDNLKASNSSLLAFGAITLQTARQASSTFSLHNIFSPFVASSQFDVSLNVSGSTSLTSDRVAICDIASLYTFKAGSTSDSSSENWDSSSHISPGVLCGSADFALVGGTGVPGDQAFIAARAATLHFLGHRGKGCNYILNDPTHNCASLQLFHFFEEPF